MGKGEVERMIFLGKRTDQMFADVFKWLAGIMGVGMLVLFILGIAALIKLLITYLF